MAFVTTPGGRGVAGRLFGPVISLPAVRHTATVIMLHGLGDTGNGWAPVAPELGLPHVKWIFPTAPTRPISVNMGMQMPGWFDIDHLDESSFRSMIQGHKSFDPEGIEESVGYVKHLIAREIEAGIPAERIVVGGFSQGGHVALKTALQHAPRLAGCVALSTWLEPLNNGNSNISLVTNVPIFHGHGTADPLIPITIAAATQKVFESLSCSNVESKFYPGMAHSSCAEEMADLKKFLTTVLPEIVAPPPTRDEVNSMSTRQLKDFLHSRGISTVGLLEKNELLTKALDSL